MPPFIKKWEEDLGVGCEKSWVGSILGATHSTAIVMKTIETNYKCLSRWYMTPTKISKFMPDRLPKCWRGCEAPGTMAHLWWDCPKIKSLWQEVIKWIEVIVGRVIKLDPWVCLFHGSEGSYRHYKTSLIPVLLNSAKSAIPKKWQEVEGPGISQSINHILWKTLRYLVP